MLAELYEQIKDIHTEQLHPYFGRLVRRWDLLSNDDEKKHSLEAKINWLEDFIRFGGKDSGDQQRDLMRRGASHTVDQQGTDTVHLYGTDRVYDALKTYILNQREQANPFFIRSIAEIDIGFEIEGTIKAKAEEGYRGWELRENVVGQVLDALQDNDAENIVHSNMSKHAFERYARAELSQKL